MNAPGRRYRYARDTHETSTTECCQRCPVGLAATGSTPVQETVTYSSRAIGRGAPTLSMPLTLRRIARDGAHGGDGGALVCRGFRKFFIHFAGLRMLGRCGRVVAPVRARTGARRVRVEGARTARRAIFDM